MQYLIENCINFHIKYKTFAYICQRSEGHFGMLSEVKLGNNT